MIHAFSAYSDVAGSTRVRLSDWFEFLGLAPRWHTFAGTSDNRPRTLLRNARASLGAHRGLSRIAVASDTVIISREASPFSRGDIEERILLDARHSVYDFDDALFVEPSAARTLIAGTDKCRRCCRAADTVIAGNAHLADWAVDYGRNVCVIPSCVNPGNYVAPVEIPPVQDPPRLVWIGSKSTERHLESILPALRAVHHKTGARLMLIGAETTTRRLDSEAFIDRVAWRAASFAQQLAQADIGLAPLPDEPFTRGKCAYKLLQYAATALPMIGSPVGANGLALKQFRGHAATTVDEWVVGLQDLIYASETDRRQRSAAALDGVRRHYSFEAWKAEWVSALGISTPADRSPG